MVASGQHLNTKRISEDTSIAPRSINVKCKFGHDSYISKAYSLLTLTNWSHNTQGVCCDSTKEF